MQVGHTDEGLKGRKTEETYSKNITEADWLIDGVQENDWARVTWTAGVGPRSSLWN